MKKTFILLAVLMIQSLVFAQKKSAASEIKKTTKVAVSTPAPTPVVVEAPKVTTNTPVKVINMDANNTTGTFAPKPKNPFEIGVVAGLSAMQGDVNSNIGLNFQNSTFGVYVRKAFGYFFSMRLQYNYHNITMRHDQPHYSAQRNNVPTLPGANPMEWYPSTQTYAHTFCLDQIFNIGNNSIHKLNTKINYELFAGPALIFYRTKLDVLDNFGKPYNWSQVDAAYAAAVQQNNIISGDNSAKAAAGRELDKMLNGTYETLGDNNKVKASVGGYAMVPAITFGAAINFLVGQRFSAGLEQRFFYVMDDYVDGERWANYATSVGEQPAYSQNNDIIMTTTAKLGYFLGAKGTKPLYWQNPSAYVINKMAAMDPKKAVRDAFVDDDGDGIPNILDQELESKAGYPVDVKGVMLDSDKDGFLDADDKEPYSPTGYPIDNKGVAIIPPPACCKEMAEKVKVVEQPKSNTPSVICAETVLPTAKFPKDKFGVHAAIASDLQKIGEKMQACPDMKLVVAGINDKNNKNGKYNEQLSYNRANEVVNYLSEKFGLSRDRFITKYNQDGVGDLEADRAVMFRNAQTGETGVSNPPAPHPGLKAGSK